MNERIAKIEAIVENISKYQLREMNQDIQRVEAKINEIKTSQALILSKLEQLTKK
ncbi:MAG: hypothetical protein [Phage NGI4]|nr:MAG: hypothetical protein [Phage NGI4]